MVKARADLHTHSKFSDGLLKPTELIELAATIRLGGIALTDHDTLDGLYEFTHCSNPADIRRVAGVEIGTEFRGKEIHILGYYVDDKSKNLQDLLKRLRDARILRFPKMIAKLEEMGIHIPEESIERILTGVESPARPHLARLLVEHGFTEDLDESFSKYVGVGKPAYVRKERVETTEAIEVLKETGAVPVMAHPLFNEIPNLKEVLNILRDRGLEGIELEYDYSHIGLNVNNDSLKKYAKEFDLVCTGGSDFHGDDERIRLGSVSVPLSVIDELEDRRET